MLQRGRRRAGAAGHDSSTTPSFGPAKLALTPRPVNPIERPALVRQLLQATQPAILLQGPAGYGKTALLRQWSDQDPSAFTWVSVDESDSDPVVLHLLPPPV